MGAFAASILAKPFLGVPASSPVAATNLTQATDEEDDQVNEAVPSGIGTLYPITGIVVFAVCTGYLYLGSKEILDKVRRGRRIAGDTEEDCTGQKKEEAHFFGNQVTNLYYGIQMPITHFLVRGPVRS